MKRLTSMTILVGFAAANVGCIAVVKHESEVYQASDKQVVAMDDSVYVVDVSDGSIEKIDPIAFAEAPTFRTHDGDDDAD